MCLFVLSVLSLYCSCCVGGCDCPLHSIVCCRIVMVELVVELLVELVVLLFVSCACGVPSWSRAPYEKPAQFQKPAHHTNI